MLTSNRVYLNLRWSAILPLLLFTPAVVAFFVAPDVWWGEYLGIFFHLAILFLVSRLDAAQWSRACGYAWVALDVLAGVLMINGIDYEIAWTVRLGAHVMAGVWIVSSSLVARSWVIRTIGVVTGLWLAGYSLVAPQLGEEFLRPAGILILVWFGAIAATANTRRPQPLAAMQEA
ncbi:hypothetical protein [Microbacterium timonense]|uniref:hypothetical protein n=1 Tax=Microbacterium timonense TaxID=2086576 RepID=UPI000D0EB503|nr:hypothetical protein [Microbacterium timonense]